MPVVGLELVFLQSQVQHSTTESLRFTLKFDTRNNLPFYFHCDIVLLVTFFYVFILNLIE